MSVATGDFLINKSALLMMLLSASIEPTGLISLAAVKGNCRLPYPISGSGASNLDRSGASGRCSTQCKKS